MISGCVLSRFAAPPLIVLTGIILTVFVILRFKFKKIHYLYFLFPILYLSGCITMNYSIKIYDTVPEGECTLSGTVYKVTENSYGYSLYIKQGFFDHKRIILSSDVFISPGTEIMAEGILQKFSEPSNPGEFDLKRYYNSQKIYARMKIIKITVKEENSHPVLRLAYQVSDILSDSLDKMTGERYASVYKAMLLGRKDELDADIAGLFSSGGIGHILAISGLHISLIGMGLYRLIRKTGAGYVLSMIISSMFILFYGLMTGNSVSAVRAAIMFITAVYANTVGRTYDMPSAVSLAAVISLLDAPMLIYNCGFLLSYLAIIGISYVSESIKVLFEKTNKITDSIISGISVQLATLPVTLYYFFQIPVLSVFLNLIVIPLMTVVMISGITGGIIGIFSTAAGEVLLSPGVTILRLYEKLCGMNEMIPWSTYTPGRPCAVKIILYYFLLIVFVVLMKKYAKKRYLTIIPVMCALLLIKTYPEFSLTFLDTGQGDGMVIQYGKNTVIVDSGSSDNRKLYEYTLEPYLLSNGITEIDYAIVTHCDNDHISGIKDMLEAGTIKIKKLYMPSVDSPDEEYCLLKELAENTETEVCMIYRGMVMYSGSLEIECLHPEKNYSFNDKNAYSTVLRIAYGNFSALLTGDISSAEEELLLRDGNLTKNITVYKAAHHGSKYSNSMELLSYIKPRYTVISSGEDNSYGHPHKETLERISASGSYIYRTDESGGIIVTMDKGKMNIKSVKVAKNNG